MGLYDSIYKGYVCVRTVMYSYQCVSHGVYTHNYNYNSMVPLEQAEPTGCSRCSYGISERSHQYFMLL